MNKIVDILASFVSNFSHLEIETNIMGIKVRLINANIQLSATATAPCHLSGGKLSE